MLTTSQLFWILFIPSIDIWITFWCYHNLVKQTQDLKKEIRGIQDNATSMSPPKL